MSQGTKSPFAVHRRIEVVSRRPDGHARINHRPLNVPDRLKQLVQWDRRLAVAANKVGGPDPAAWRLSVTEAATKVWHYHPAEAPRPQGMRDVRASVKKGRP